MNNKDNNINTNSLKNTNILLQIKNLTKSFSNKRKSSDSTVLLANDDISLDIYEGETLGLVGESGCGKSTLGKCILNLYKNTKGEVLYYRDNIPVNLLELSEKEMRPIRNDLQLIFQDPFSSLNPSMTVYELISEGPVIHNIYKKNDPLLKEFVFDLMKKCGLDSEMADRYPHQFSGGQRQRICIARCLATNPRFIVCDEAVSALDVSIQAQILNLLKKIKKENGLTYLFISHNISVVKYMSDRVAVMYNGKIVELAYTDDLFATPLHPYTLSLLNAVPGSVKNISSDIVETCEITSNNETSDEYHSDTVNGCAYFNRCPYRMDICKTTIPTLKEYGDSHFVSCHKCLK